MISLMVIYHWWSLIIDDHWSLIIGHWWSLIIDDHWSLMIIYHWWSLITDDHWSLMINGSKVSPRGKQQVPLAQVWFGFELELNMNLNWTWLEFEINWTCIELELNWTWIFFHFFNDQLWIVRCSFCTCSALYMSGVAHVGCRTCRVWHM